MYAVFKMIAYIKVTLILSCFLINLTDCQKDETQLTTSLMQLSHEQCPPWFFYNTTTKQCECSISPFDDANEIVKCTEHGVLLGNKFCMTYEEGEGVSVGYCTYFELDGHNRSKSDLRFIELPENVSELNDYMCGPMNRKGILCSECIDGFGPSMTSPNFACTECTNVWYGVLFYLLVELVPVSVFYLIILIFQINVTSAPMVSFVLSSHIIIVAINIHLTNQHFITVFSTLYGIWNLDFIRYAIPPFCISPKLKIAYVLCLQSISIIFPLILIGITWLCIKLYPQNFEVMVRLWNAINRLLKCINVKRETWSIIDTFATFFLLSYAKLTFMLLVPLHPLTVFTRNNLNISSTRHAITDPSVEFVSVQHLPFVAVSILGFLIVALPPVLLLALYPTKAFRSLLFKINDEHPFMASLNIFVEKFYSCYRDIHDGGRDMRSLASLYFFVVLLCYILWTSIAAPLLIAVLFAGCSLFIALVQPYKEKYMTVIDSLILANMAILSILLDKFTSDSSLYQVLSIISLTLPLFGLVTFTVYNKLLKNALKQLLEVLKQRLKFYRSFLRCCNKNKNSGVKGVLQGDLNPEGGGDLELPDRIVHPEQYVLYEDSR